MCILILRGAAVAAAPACAEMDKLFLQHRCRRELVMNLLARGFNWRALFIGLEISLADGKLEISV